jgi:hypothetical protein
VTTNYYDGMGQMICAVDLTAVPVNPISADDAIRLDNDFTYHPPQTRDTATKYVFIRGACKFLATLLIRLCPSSRERSIALTKIEEAMMWANASIAREGGRSSGRVASQSDAPAGSPGGRGYPAAGGHRPSDS